MNKITLSNRITLHYQDIGDKAAPAIILIMGLGAQMTVWPDSLYYGLANKGFRVIRFDNRDAGLSSHLNDYGEVNLLKVWLAKRLPLKVSLPYTLEDMADDVMQLIGALNINSYHLVGASMGGMIAQLISAKKNNKVRSLTSIMSGPTGAKLTMKNIMLLAKLAHLQRHSHSRAEAIQYTIKLNQLIGSPDYPQQESQLRQQATQYIDRAYNPSAVKRQLAALTASHNRAYLLQKIKAPTLIIHGAEDILIPPTAALQTARMIKKAKLKILPGVGHNLPPAMMKKYIKWITKHVTKAELKHNLKLKNSKSNPIALSNNR